MSILLYREGDISGPDLQDLQDIICFANNILSIPHFSTFLNTTYDIFGAQANEPPTYIINYISHLANVATPSEIGGKSAMLCA